MNACKSFFSPFHNKQESYSSTKWRQWMNTVNKDTHDSFIRKQVLNQCVSMRQILQTTLKEICQGK